MMNWAGLTMLRILPLLFTMCVLALELSSAANYFSSVISEMGNPDVFGDACELEMWQKITIKRNGEKINKTIVQEDCFKSIINQLSGDEAVLDAIEKFHIYTAHNTWDNAKEICKSSSLKFASVLNDKENNNLINTLVDEGHTGKNFWLGGITIDGKTWQWNEEKGQIKTTYENWESGHPKNDNVHTCLMLNKNYKWESHKCDDRLPFLCHKTTMG